MTDANEQKVGINAPVADEDKIREALINYLSKEIETHTNSRTVWRSRFNFTVFFSPVVLLGFYLLATKGNIPKLDFGRDIVSLVAALIGIFICFLLGGLGYAMVERAIWNQCNRWRRVIFEIQASSWQGKPEDLVFRNPFLVKAYLLVYILMAVFFGLLMYVSTYIVPAEGAV